MRELLYKLDDLFEYGLIVIGVLWATSPMLLFINVDMFVYVFRYLFGVVAVIGIMWNVYSWMMNHYVKKWEL